MVSRLLIACVVVLTAAGELEVLLASVEPAEALVSALAVPAITLPLLWARRAPLPALLVVALVLLLQAALGGMLVGSSVTTIAVLALLLYCAGRSATDVRRLAGAAGAAALIAATRIEFDAAARPPREALLTIVAVAAPLLVGRWSREQRLLQRELADRATRNAGERAHAARDAADEERARIAMDLQSAVAGNLQAIVTGAERLQADLRAGHVVVAREQLGVLADLARAALADVRRILGVLRHDDEPRPLAPSQAPPLQPAAPMPPAPRPNPPPVASPRAHRLRSPRRTLAGHERLVDWLIAAAVFAIAAAELALTASAAAALTSMAVCAPLLWRRRRPLTAAVAVLFAIGVQSALVDLDSFPLGDALAMVVATYAIGAYAGPPWGIAGLLVMAIGAGAHAAVFYPDGVVAALLGGVALPWTVGRVVRGNRDRTREGRRRNAEIERSRDREARAAITRERVRVARELHDAVAHSLSVVAIQAGGAEGLVERDPRRARECAELIATLSREALAELARLGALPASIDTGADPAPSLSRVDLLAARARAAGLAVTLSVDGPPVALSAGVDLAAYRIVQEALTNTTKHARATQAWVTVRYRARALELEIADDGRSPRAGRGTADGGGHGLLGMRERVALYGGSLDAGPRPGSAGYLVRARLPIEGA